VLEQALWLASTLKPLGDDQRRELLARTAPYAREGKWEAFKTTHQFDGTVQNPRWLTSAEL
jgi:hypothetical protein